MPMGVSCLSSPAPRLILVEMGGIEHHQPCELARGGGGDDLSAKATFDKQWDAAAMVEMSMSEQEIVDLGGLEAERVGIFLVKLAAALEHPAVNQDAAPGTVHHMAGAGDAPIGAVEGKSQDCFVSVG